MTVKQAQLMSMGGLVIALFLLGMTALSTWLLIDSAGKISEAVAIVTAIALLLAYLALAYVSTKTKQSAIKITHLGTTNPLDSLTPLYFFVLACGFIQTLFWVLQPSDSNHEPR